MYRNHWARTAPTSDISHTTHTAFPNLEVNLGLPKGLVIGLGHAIARHGTSIVLGSAHTAAERAIEGEDRWSLMLPTSARVPQEVCEPLIGIQCPALCNIRANGWEITTSIWTNNEAVTGLRRVNWVHKFWSRCASHGPPSSNYSLRLPRNFGQTANCEQVLALTATTGATALRTYFQKAQHPANAESWGHGILASGQVFSWENQDLLGGVFGNTAADFCGKRP